MAEAVWLVVWDLDETFWKDALTERGMSCNRGLDWPPIGKAKRAPVMVSNERFDRWAERSRRRPPGILLRPRVASDGTDMTGFAVSGGEQSGIDFGATCNGSRIERDVAGSTMVRLQLGEIGDGRRRAASSHFCSAFDKRADFFE